MLGRLLGLIFWAVLGAVTVLGLALYADYRAFLETPLGEQTEAEFSVEPGDSIQRVALRLVSMGLMDSPLYFRLHARLTGQAGRIQVGEYRIGPEDTPATLLAAMASGKVLQRTLTVVEGWTFRQLREALAAHPQIHQTLGDRSDAEIMAELGHPDQHPEGRFFPDTYHFPSGFTDLEFLQRAHQRMAEVLAEAWAQRIQGLPLKSPDEALILASIVERETGQSGERREVAGVFIRRLEQDWLLQTDPTVIYGLGESFDGNLRRRDLETDTPYNTYTRKGLPPTPIAMPGRASLEAAVNPASGDAMYFVARGDGSHVFSRTLAEHNRAVRQYQLRQGSQ